MMATEIIEISASLASIAFTLVITWGVVHYLKNRKNIIADNLLESAKLKSYERIISLTYKVEDWRMPNHGEYHDEKFYLDRAKDIRTKTNFYKKVNRGGKEDERK